MVSVVMRREVWPVISVPLVAYGEVGGDHGAGDGVVCA
jgi:hypothetical protein